jgi:hypothetical protein
MDLDRAPARRRPGDIEPLADMELELVGVTVNVEVDEEDEVAVWVRDIVLVGDDDPLAVAVLTRPDLCEFREVAVSVVTGDGPARGVMLTDRRQGAEPPAANARVAVSVDSDAFTERFLGLITGL